MASRRSVLKFGLCGCLACAVKEFTPGIGPAHADQPAEVLGNGYAMHFVGAQRDTVMHGKLAAALDLRTLAKTAHLYGIGPIEHLRGEVTIANSRPALARVDPQGAVKVQESFEAGVPFFVWAEVPSWQTIALPAQVRSFGELEKLLPDAAAAAGVDLKRPLPFLLRGRTDLIEFHVLNRVGDEPHNPEKHKHIQKVFEAESVDAIIVGFYAPATRGIFTPMDSAIHIHFQSANNGISGHVQNLRMAEGVTVAFPAA